MYYVTTQGIDKYILIYYTNTHINIHIKIYIYIKNYDLL